MIVDLPQKCYFLKMLFITKFLIAVSFHISFSYRFKAYGATYPTLLFQIQCL